MGWLSTLHEVYENCQRQVGVRGADDGRPLLPVYHTVQQAQITVTVDIHGAWQGAEVVADKADQATIMPCTERSASRSNGIYPHPLADKLSYVAGDYNRFARQPRAGYDCYMAQLKAWCQSGCGHDKVRAVYGYLKQARLLEDLLEAGLLRLDQDGRLMERWDGGLGSAPPIFQACAGKAGDALVRFAVAAEGEGAADGLWADHKIWSSYMDYRASDGSDADLCYGLGRRLPRSTVAPKYILRPGDNAKLISSNDRSGFTYRGRFLDAEEACCLSREAVEKAHNALRWLIDRQGYRCGGQAIVAFGLGGRRIWGLEESSDAMQVLLGRDAARPLETAVNLESPQSAADAEAAIIGLEALTPGRLSIFFYRRYRTAELTGRIQGWHNDCAWPLYRRRQIGEDSLGRPIYRYNRQVGAPSVEEIVTAAYGKDAAERQRNFARRQLLACVAEGAPLPRDMVRCALTRATNPAALDWWTAWQVQQTACALVRKGMVDDGIIGQGRGRTVEQQAMQEDRSYLFGRLLAAAHHLERCASGEAERRLPTLAQRMQPAFVRRPAQVWALIHKGLYPYTLRLARAGKDQAATHSIYEILQSIERVGGFHNGPLRAQYILGYAAQMMDFEASAAAAKTKNGGRAWVQKQERENERTGQ